MKRTESPSENFRRAVLFALWSVAPGHFLDVPFEADGESPARLEPLGAR